MAVELGYFEKEGVVVERVCCPSGTGEVSPDFLFLSFDSFLPLSLLFHTTWVNLLHMRVDSNPAYLSPLQQR